MESLSSGTALLERPGLVDTAALAALREQTGSFNGFQIPTSELPVQQTPDIAEQPVMQQEGLLEARRDERLERFWRPDMDPAPQPREVVTPAESKPARVARNAGAVAIHAYTSIKNKTNNSPNGEALSSLAKLKNRYTYEGNHRQAGIKLTNHGNTTGDKPEVGKHRTPPTPMDRLTDFAREQVTDPKKRNRLVAAAVAGSISLGLMMTNHNTPEAVQARLRPNTAYGTDSSHSKSNQVTRIVYEKVAQISPRQEKEIDNLKGLSKAQKDSLTDFADAVIKLKHEGKLKDVNTEVMTAQWSQETGNGKSSLGKKYHNYFGIKAGKGWNGPKVTVSTKEEVNGKLVSTKAAFRVYKDTKAGILGYRDKLRNSWWFRDALGHPNDAGKTLDNLLDDKMAWATDSSYKKHVLGRSKDIHAASITKVEKINVTKRIISLKPKDKAVKPPETNNKKEPWYKVGFKLKHKNSERQQILEKNKSGKAWITLPNGKRKLDRNIGRAERIKIIEHNLNGAHATPEGYKEFLKEDFIDLTGKVPKMMDNFDGRRNGMGTPKPKGVIKRLVHHYTATNSNVDTYDGVRFAGTMQHSGGLGVQFDTNKKDKVYWLTKSRTSHVKGFNTSSWGNENHAPSQAGVSAEQYENNVYLDVKFLTENRYVNKKTPVSKTVDSMIVGHHEMNPYGHTDFPKPVMDVIRTKVKNLLVQMGYKR